MQGGKKDWKAKTRIKTQILSKLKEGPPLEIFFMMEPVVTVTSKNANACFSKISQLTDRGPESAMYRDMDHLVISLVTRY